MLTATTFEGPTEAGMLPRAPDTLAEAGLSLDLLTQLALKHLHLSGELKGSDLAARLGVNFAVVEPALAFLKEQHQIEVAGGAMTGSSSYRYRITDGGRTRVLLFLQSNKYV